MGRPMQDLAVLFASGVGWKTQRLAPHLVGAYVEERERLRVLAGGEPRRVELLIYEMDALVKQLRVCVADYVLHALDTGLWASIASKDAVRARFLDPAAAHEDMCTREPRCLVWTVVEAEGALPLLDVPEGADEDANANLAEFKGFDSSAPPSEMSISDASDYGTGMEFFAFSP